jgi:hypothetical protein
MSSCYEAARPGANAGSYRTRAGDMRARTVAVLDVTRYVPTLPWPGIGAPATAASWLWSAAAAGAEDSAPADPQTLAPETRAPETRVPETPVPGT